MKKQNLAIIREDIRKDKLRVPIGRSGYYGGKKPLPYRWKGDEIFQVKFKGSWKTAQSIDFDFI